MAKVYQNQPFNTNTKSYYLWQIYLFITAKLAGHQLSFITYIYINLFSLINSESKSIIVPTHVGVNRNLGIETRRPHSIVPTHVGVNRTFVSSCQDPNNIVPTHVGVNRKSSLVLPFITKAKAHLKQIANLELISLGASQDKLELWLMNSQQRK